MRFFSYKNRPFHLGPYPLETLARTDETPDLGKVPPMTPLVFRREDAPVSLVNAMAEFQATLDAIREGIVRPERGVIPSQEKASGKTLLWKLQTPFLYLHRLPQHFSRKCLQRSYILSHIVLKTLGIVC